MQLSVQKKLAASCLKCSTKRVRFNPLYLEDIKEAITKADMKSVISQGMVYKIPEKGTSRARARKRAEQRRKGRQKGQGKRKGKTTARLPKKEGWMNKIRLQRELLKQLKDKQVIGTKDYRSLYAKAKGGAFRSRRHLKLYINEHVVSNTTKKKGSVNKEK